MAARYEENGKLSEAVPSLEDGGHRLAVTAGTSTCHLVQVLFTLSLLKGNKTLIFDM